ncbi:MAG: hypothetical protein IKU37_09275 [Candidatus Gastranaerophilales bacterium]|nr:hypothetical protein [Candidatus Gastranaerophilales bacterium]
MRISPVVYNNRRVNNLHGIKNNNQYANISLNFKSASNKDKDKFITQHDLDRNKIPLGIEQLCDIGVCEKYKDVYLSYPQYVIGYQCMTILLSDSYKDNDNFGRINLWVNRFPDDEKIASFGKDELFAMYTNPKYLDILLAIAKKRPEDVIAALSSMCRASSCDKRKQQQEKELAINAWEMTPERVNFFQKLLKLSPVNATRILPLMKKEYRDLILAPYKQGARTSSLMCGDINFLLEEANKKPDLIISNLAVFDKAKGDFNVNLWLKDKNKNYSQILSSLLVKKPKEFFKLMEDSNFLWHAAGNESQRYLEFIETCMVVDPIKTIELLSRKIIDPNEGRFVSSFERAIDNKTFNSPELMKATYQSSPAHAFAAFDAVVDCDDDKKMNLLTYFVDKKGVAAEDFITYLTNFNLLFVKSLLSVQTIEHLQDLKYKTALEKLETTRKELLRKMGNDVSQTKKDALDAVMALERELIAHMHAYQHKPRPTPASCGNRVNLHPSIDPNAWNIPASIPYGSIAYGELLRSSGSLAYHLIRDSYCE